MNKYKGDGSLANEDNQLIPPKSFEPLGNLVVMRIVPKEKSKGGILYPDELKDVGGDKTDRVPRMGWVVSAGCQCRYVRRGDLALMDVNMRQIAFIDHEGVLLAVTTEQNLTGIVQDANGQMPEFEVADWKEQIVKRF